MTLYAPRCWLLLNGAMIPCESATVNKKAKRAADTFSAKLSITRTTQYGMDVAAWADYQPSDVEIYMSVMPDQSDLTSMITGQIDKPKIDWATYMVDVSGRDKSASMIETRRSQKFPNQKSSDIVSTIAQDNGLTAQVTGTSDYAGKQYNEGDVNHMTLHRTDFEIVSDLADREGFRRYVSGTSLIFEPKSQSPNLFQGQWCPPAVQAAYGYATIRSLETSRNMTAAKPTTVNVKSWHPKDKKLYVGQGQAQDGAGNPISIDHHHNGKTQDEANTLAQSRAMDAIRHDCSCTVETAVDVTVEPKTTQFELSGTGTIFDQTYDIDEAQFEIGWSAGGSMKLTCKSPKGRTVSQGGSSDGTDSAAGDGGDSSSSSVPTPPPRPADLPGGSQEIIST